MLAADAPAAQPDIMLKLMVPMIVVMGVMMFLQSRSAKKKLAEHQAMLGKLKSGDRVVTSSGIVGTVIAAKEKTVTVRTAGDTKLEFTRGSISEVTTAGSDSSEA